LEVGRVSPLGFKINFGQQSWIKPFLAASVGFLYFEKDVPLPNSSQFNFTPEVGLGVHWFVTPANAVTVGYRFHHISNAGTHRRNPGLDLNLIYAGYSFFTP
jgi:Lipid A 3-O-deacylase (PagL)